MTLTKRILAVSMMCAGFVGLAVAQGNLAAGWSQRPDGGTAADNKLTMEGPAIHIATGGPPTNNATFYNPAWTASGNRTYGATFTQNVKSTHPDAYGLMIGGSNLDKDDQSYTYFEVRQAGEFYIATRKGAAVTPVVAWTKNAAIVPEGPDGKQVNTLAITVNGNDVVFSVNGTEVSKQPKSAVLTDGLYGFRVSHRLDITVTDIKK
jgi:hypothetical protein